MSYPSNEDILAAVDKLKDDSVQMLKEIVAEPSLLGDEKSVQDFMERKFGALTDPKLVVERIPIQHNEIKSQKGYSPVVDWGYYDEDPHKNAGKVNIIATRKVDHQQGKSLILNGHVDVVPTGPHNLWSNPPFSPVVKDGRLYGRGAGDMKAGIVAYYQAYKAILSLGYAPASPIQMQTVVEEECTGNGALAVASSMKADAVIIPEPFNQLIVTGQLGVLWLKVSVQGRPAHVLDTSAGINALDAAYHMVQSLKSLEESWNAPELRPELWKDFKHPINFNFGTINGGEWPSSVPCFAEFQLRIGFFPNQQIEDVKRAVEAALDTAAKAKNLRHSVVYNGFHAEGTAFPTAESDFFKALHKAHEDVMHQPPKYGALTCTTDGRFFQLYHGIPTTCYGPESTSIHGIDESVSLESMNNVTKVIALFIAHWCKLEPLN